MKRIILSLFFVSLFFSFTNAQINLSMPEQTLTQSGGNVTVPINVTNFNGVGAVSLIISYDPTVLNFTGTSNNPAHGNFLTPTASNGQIIISWFDTSPLNIGSGVFLDLNFTHIQGSSDLDFVNSSCEIADTAANVLNIVLKNGKVNGPSGGDTTATLSGNVWLDSNGDGIKNSGEKGLNWITIDLFTCSNGWAGWTMTDSLGNFTFKNLPAGSYYGVFFLIDGYKTYKFTTANVGSDPSVNSHVTQFSDTSGKSDCVTLSAGQTYSYFNAGVINNVTPSDTGAPQIWLTKDDGLDIAPDSGNTTTYTITYGNSGTASLYNTVITDTLPAGMSYVSSTSGNESSAGSNIVVFNLGTLQVGSNANVQLTAKVSATESNYYNIAYLQGTDSKSNKLSTSASDLDLADTVSNSGDSGLESSGDMAQLLLTRRLLIKYGMTTPIVKTKGAKTVASVFNLSDLIPASGPFNSQAVESTPFDILGVSNAIASYGINYQTTGTKSQMRVGGIFSTITAAPYIYDHSKAVCDRLGGSQIDEIKLININGYLFFAAKFEKPDQKVTDYAISFSVYETPSGFSVQNKWTYEEYQSPQGATNVYNFQAWSSSYDAAVQIVKGIIAKFQAKNQVSYLNTSQYTPDIFIRTAQYTHDGNIHLSIMNTNQASKQVSISTSFRVSQNDNQVSTASSSYNLQSGVNNITIPTGVISDANLSMSEAQGFGDEAYVSGGAYTYLSGPNSTVDTFITNGYPQEVTTNFPKSSLILSGGASVAGKLNDWITIVRSFNAEGSVYDLSSYGSVQFTASGNGTAEVFFNLSTTQNYNYYVYKVNLTADSKVYTVNFSQFQLIYGGQTALDPKQIEDFGLIINNTDNPGLKSYSVELKDIAFITTGITGVNDKVNSIPTQFNLSQNYPNPFNPSTVIEFSVPQQEKLSLTVYNILGQKVAALINGEISAGYHMITFNASKLSSGIYFYQLLGDHVNITKKMILTK